MNDTLDLWQTAASLAEEGSSLALPAAAEPDGSARYLDLGYLTAGGMGELRRVWDRRLGRPVVRKILADPFSRRAWERFANEARLTARLEHPGIVPVYDFGILPDGRPWFAMKQVEGRTFTEVIAAVHSGQGWSLRRAIDALRRVCEAVAFAHSRGVIHRDLKPDNIMVGAFGQVYVMDWGIARLPESPELASRELEDIGAGSGQTRAGAVLGTPLYMAPEQARGEVDRHGPASDVYALGAVLWHLLVGRPPYLSSADVLHILRKNPTPPAPQHATDRALPEELCRLTRAAMRADPAARPANAAAFAVEIESWLDGSRRRAEAMLLVEQARDLLPRVDGLLKEAAAHRQLATQQLADVRTWDPVEKKQPAWVLEDEADAREHRAALIEVEVTQLLRTAITSDPTLDIAHQLLADRYRLLHQEALAQGDRAARLRYEALLRRHDRGKHRGWLAGKGRLSLASAPPGDVRIARSVEQGRRQVLEDVRAGMRTPIRDLSLPAGSYLATITAPGHAPVSLPLLVPRDGAADGTRPGAAAPAPVALPPAALLGPEDVYVPAGWAILGRPAARNGLPRRRIWVDGFILRRYPVTNTEYLAFLNDLLARGRSDEALQWVPREQTPTSSDAAAPVYHRRPDGTFFLGEDATGDVWHPDWPVVMITWDAAQAWCAWEAARTGQPWRLAWEFEREKAAAGVDGRCYPWGDFPEPTWSHNQQGQPGRGRPAPSREPLRDISPYGVVGLAGNSRDWCNDLRQGEPDVSADGLWRRPEQPAPGGDDTWRLYLGGGWTAGLSQGQIGARYGAPARYRGAAIGLRAARSWPTG